MDRELVLIALTLLLLGLTLPLGALLGWLTRDSGEAGLSGDDLERAATVRLLFPLGPAVLSLFLLLGWALVEPEDAERVPWWVFVAATPVAAIGLRAALRATRALAPLRILTVATVGLLRPRVVFNEAFARQLDSQARAAARAHEDAHARHRDPLRIWFAQIATDLQWPMPGARDRLERWLSALEQARDDEARATVDGEDLAAAVLAAARVERPTPFAGAGITSAGVAIRVRIERLLAPLPHARQRPWRRVVVLVGAALGIALLLGSSFGEVVISGTLGWGR